MLYKPFHALCSDRSKQSKKHQLAGDAEDWFSPSLLAEFNIKGVNFDFFINWSTNELSKEFWVKRLLTEEEIPSASKNAIEQLIYTCDGKENVKDLCEFASQYGVVKYKLFRECNNWKSHQNNPTPILDVTMNSEGNVDEITRVSLEGLEDDIKELSGGPVRIGTKGLIYGYTTLECHLSTTDALWPGDVDSVLVDESNKPLAILEYKKHTLREPMENYKFEHYYHHRRVDRRKYDRLALLRDELGDIPIIVIYYPTQNVFNEVILELIEGDVGNLQSSKETRHPLPIDEQGRKNLIEHIISHYLS